MTERKFWERVKFLIEKQILPQKKKLLKLKF